MAFWGVRGAGPAAKGGARGSAALGGGQPGSCPPPCRPGLRSGCSRRPVRLADCACTSEARPSVSRGCPGHGVQDSGIVLKQEARGDPLLMDHQAPHRVNVTGPYTHGPGHTCQAAARASAGPGPGSEVTGWVLRARRCALGGTGVGSSAFWTVPEEESQAGAGGPADSRGLERGIWKLFWSPSKGGVFLLTVPQPRVLPGVRPQTWAWDTQTPRVTAFCSRAPEVG